MLGCFSRLGPPYFFRILKIPQELDQSNFPSRNYPNSNNNNNNSQPMTTNPNRMNNRNGSNGNSDGNKNKSNLHTVSLTSADNGVDAKRTPMSHSEDVGNPYSSWPEGNEDNEDVDNDGTINVSVDH